MDIIHDPPRLLSSLLGLTTLSSIAFFISSCVTAGTANAGFTTFITSLMYLGFCLGGLYTITRTQTSISVGFLIGVSLMLCIQSFQTAVFWGQLSHCDVKFGGVEIGKVRWGRGGREGGERMLWRVLLVS